MNHAGTTERPLSEPPERVLLTKQQLADAKSDLVEEICRGEYKGMPLSELLASEDMQEPGRLMERVFRCEDYALADLLDYHRALAGKFLDGEFWRVEMRASRESGDD